MVEDDTNIQLEIPSEKEMKLTKNEVEKEFCGLDFLEKMESGVHAVVAAQEQSCQRAESRRALG